ncbi:ER membrane protein SH3-domain-containing protein [Gongronella butleri]|nr:ER membrane protein SH3-domain-containing protein [Gongronella butleri]
MKKAPHQKSKAVMILCSCFFAYGTFWSDWAYDYDMLWKASPIGPQDIARGVMYYKAQTELPQVLQYVPLANLFIGVCGISAGLAGGELDSKLFDGASVVLLLFAVSTFASSVKPSLVTIADASSTESQLLTALKVLAITGIIGLQLAHLFVMRKSGSAQAVEGTEPTEGEADATASSKKNN